MHDSASETATTMQQLDSAVGEIADGASSQAGDTQLATEKVVNMGDMVEQTANQVDDLMKYATRMQQSGQGATEALEQLEQVNGSGNAVYSCDRRTDRYDKCICKQEP